MQSIALKKEKTPTIPLFPSSRMPQWGGWGAQGHGSDLSHFTSKHMPQTSLLGFGGRLRAREDNGKVVRFEIMVSKWGGMC